MNPLLLFFCTILKVFFFLHVHTEENLLDVPENKVAFKQ